MAKIKSVTSAMSMKATMKPSFAKKRSGGQSSFSVLNLSMPKQKKGKPVSPMKKSKKGLGY